MDYWFKSKIAPTGEVLKEEFPSFEVITPEESLDWLIYTIKQRYLRNNLTKALEKAAEQADSGELNVALSTLTNEGFDLKRSMTDRKSSVNLASDESVEARRSRFKERCAFEGDVRGAPLGFSEIDEYFMGILPGEIGTLAGYSGTGKTFAGCWSAISAWRAGWNPYFVTLEVPKDDVEDRIDCLMADVPYTGLLRGSLDRDQIKRLYAAQEERMDTKTLILDNPRSEERDVNTLIQKAIQSGSDYLIIDQLSFITSRNKRLSTRDAYGEIMNSLKTGIASGDDKIPLFMMAQFNRAQTKAKGRGGMENLAEAVFVEQYSDHVFGLTQTNEMKVNRSMAFDIFKCRRQGNKAWLLNWQLDDRSHFSVDIEIPFGED
jgi:replicative DNA helicase